ncbi:MAG TPA: hypothetical protein VIA98_13150 [Allosphingosinicella sp.]|jgi:YD repeat-containing protein
MTTTSARRAALSCALLATTAFCGLSAQPAAAQSKIINVPADKFLIAPGGVDLRTGRYAYSETDLSIGGEQGGLALNRTMPEYAGKHANPFGNFSHGWDITLLETRVDLTNGQPTGGDYRMTLHLDGRVHTFEGPGWGTGYAYKSDGGTASLTMTGGTDKSSPNAIYTFTRPDRATIVFRAIGGGDCADQPWGYGQRRCAYPSEMTEPDGTKYTFDYSSTGGSTGNLARLRRVTSSRGYVLLLEGSGSLVTKACVLNVSIAPAPANGLCPAGVPTTSYTYTSGSPARLASVTSPAGDVSSFTYAGGTDFFDVNFIKPGATTPWLTNAIMTKLDEEEALQEIVQGQYFADGQFYNYVYYQSPVTDARPYATIAGGSYTDAAGRTTDVRFEFPPVPEAPCSPGSCQFDMPDDQANGRYTYQQTPGPVEIVDPLGRSTTFNYCNPVQMATLPVGWRDRCGVVPLESFTDPEGIKTVLEYDGANNIKKATRYPKPGVLNADGSTPAPIVTEAAYDLANARTMNKPLWTKDGKGNVTSYTYAPQHGGLLTETGPAVNGVTPQKRYTYGQRYAWISNGAGGYVQAATPVWLLTQTSFCKTGNPASSGTGCANGAADEVITSYDYGPNSGPNTLLLRGTVVTADGQSIRTCQSYDANGNKISETSPKAGLSSCP